MSVGEYSDAIGAKLASLRIPPEEMLGLIDAYVKDVWDRNDPRARAALRARRNGLLRLIGQNTLNQIIARTRSRTGSMVGEFYEAAHANEAFTGYEVGQRYVTYILGDKVLQMTGMGNYRAKSRVLERVFEIIRPESVCEAGCGRIRHLTYFAAKYPAIDFSGFDISHNAIAFGRAFQQRDVIDPRWPERSGPLTAAELQRVRAINLFQSDASDLSAVPDKSYDVVYTVSALEQMHSLLPKVLPELRRVTRRYAIFCEPFREVNGPLERAFLWSDNYFRAGAEMFKRHGLRPVNLLDCLPMKPTFKDAVLIAEIRD